ncbi:MAG TPA: FAD-dependent oxidoreductase, partial [Thermoanaerobaculia bacterium]
MNVRRRGDGERVIVIGGGLGSLAAACTLAARGVPVTLLERNPWLGGKAARLEVGGFRFDMGPTILILPSVLRRLFAEAGERLERHVDLVPLDPQWRCFFADGSVLDLERDVAAMAASLDRFSPGSGREWEGFVGFSRRLHDLSERYFLWRSVGSLADTFDAGNTLRLSTLADLAALRMGRTVAGSVRSHLSDPRVAQLADHFTQYVGSAPDASPAVLCGIAHMQTSEGVWYPIGGTRAAPLALEKLARSLGV